MTRTLILVRHSKTEDRQVSSSDFDRALTGEGKSETARMGTFLLKAGISPDYILTSSAQRAYETASILAGIFKTDMKNFKASGELYYSTSKTILNKISEMPEAINCLLIVAHNPGISDLNRRLSDGKSSFMENTQVSLLKYEIDQWQEAELVKPVRFESFSIKGIS
jgi:phosphohistidine phosphatase